jgi:hypothetical protein
MTGLAFRTSQGGRGSNAGRMLSALALLAVVVVVGDCGNSTEQKAAHQDANRPTATADSAGSGATQIKGSSPHSTPTPATVGSSGAAKTGTTTGATTTAASGGSGAGIAKPTPPHLPLPAPGCPLTGQPIPAVPMTMPGCRLVASDTASNPNPIPFWGFIACQNSSRVQQLTSGGDPHLTATGAPQLDGDYRRMTVLDGDNPFGWGERCELGENDHRTGPTVFYHEGEQRVTYLSIRLPDNFNRNVNAWQDVMQMKETQPYDNSSDCCPILYFAVHNGAWRIESVHGEYATFPASSDLWTRFAFDVFYSQDPSKGWLQVSADLNSDGDFNDRGERTPVIHTPTLIAETNGPHGTSDGLAPGDSIPDHLRVGIYHNPSIPCPPPGGCSTEVDNVQVMKSPSGP